MSEAKFTLLILVTVAIFGCRTESTRPADPVDEEVRTEQLKADWFNRYTEVTNRYTAATYSCSSEMLSLKYHPVESGPTCRQMCALLEKVNAMVASAPPYVDDPTQYALGDDPKLCGRKRSKAVPQQESEERK